MLCLGNVPSKTHDKIYICLVDLHENLFHVERSISALLLSKHKIKTSHYATSSLYNIVYPLVLLTVKSVEEGVAQALYTLAEIVLLQVSGLR